MSDLAEYPYFGPTIVCVAPDSGLSDYAEELRRMLAGHVPDRSARAVDVQARLTDAIRDAEGLDAKTSARAKAAAPPAREFLRCVDPALPLPEISIDDDGDVMCEWALSKTAMLSVAIAPAGSPIHYAMLIGGKRRHGSDFFVSGIPSTLAWHLEEFSRHARATGLAG